MRGCAQSHLLECDDGSEYVVKFQNNPQGRRVLTNELVSHFVMSWLGIETPSAALVAITPEFLERNPDVGIVERKRLVAPAVGLHFGSRSPGNVSVWDFLPEAHVLKVANRADFCGALVFDKWVSNADGRQTIFYRRAIPSNTSGSVAQWWVQMIDNGHAFDGPNWSLRQSAIQGLYKPRAVYGRFPSVLTFSPWIALAESLRWEQLEEVYSLIPEPWIEGENSEFLALLRALYKRRNRLRELVRESLDLLRARPDKKPPARVSVQSAYEPELDVTLAC
jgi:hypothetical protein